MRGGGDSGGRVSIYLKSRTRWWAKRARIEATVRSAATGDEIAFGGDSTPPTPAEEDAEEIPPRVM
jgi:hypothetical protein